ncbi:ATP-binding cassette domain-containing protein [Phytohabitans kaempferiae]|uniref:ATP-binding cassette domain-containing protein n=1 Tax=Phytohabitans kaempferiae TaxID=1620943 RepID=A0ABV6M9Y9_9ACTN
MAAAAYGLPDLRPQGTRTGPYGRPGFTALRPRPDEGVRAEAAGHRAVDGVSFDVHAGETVAIVDESGSGKTATARMVLRLAAPTAGRILFQGADIARLGGRDLRRTHRHIQLVHQDPASTLDPRFPWSAASPNR